MFRRLRVQIQKIRERSSRSAGSATAARLNNEISHLESSMQTLSKDLEEIQERIDQRHEEDAYEGRSAGEEIGNRRMPNESQRDFLIRTGKITPFSKLPTRTLSRSDSTLQGMLLEAEEDEAEEELVTDEIPATERLSHRNLMQPGFADEIDSDASFEVPDDSDRPNKRRRLQERKSSAQDRVDLGKQLAASSNGAADETSDDQDSYVPDLDDRGIAALGEYNDDSSDESEGAFIMNTTPPRRTNKKRGQKRIKERQKEDLSGLDDGNERLYQKRLSSWVERRQAARARATTRNETMHGDVDSDAHGLDQMQQKDAVSHAQNVLEEEAEWHLPHPLRPDSVFEGGYRIPETSILLYSTIRRME